MSSFADLREQLASARSDRGAALSQLAIAREQLRDVRARVDAGRRVAGDRSGELEALQREEASLEEAVEGLRRDLRGLHADASGLLGQLAELDDPAGQIAELSDSVPILLFPVRLETRFHAPAGGPEGAGGPQLWIRIYPDDCQVDSFEELLTQTEVQNARAFWIAMWRAGRVEAQERGAWRSLVAGSGSGRAAYVIEQYRPASLDDRPAKVEAQDVVLVIVPEIDVTAAEETAAFAYHTAVWKADGDVAKEAAALAALRAAVGNARADAIREHFAPDPLGQEPPEPYTRAQVRVSCAVLTLPEAPPTKTTAWTQSPKAYALPDRFVALLWNGGTEVKRVVGNPIPDGLAVGPDPSLPPGEQITEVDGDLVLNDDLRWLVDFERAVEVGMGIQVDLTPAEAADGFERLLVVGLRCSSDEHDARQQLETLIGHHAASRHGFSLVPQGSPTNNTGSGGTGYTWAEDADVSYDVVFKAGDAYGESDDPLERRDGHWLAEALGIDNALLERIPNAGGSDQREARAMSIALWPATLGYWLEEMLTPLVSQPDIATTRSFFTRYVSGRGPLPAVRVGKQPYGIVLATAFSRYRAARTGLGGPAPEAAYLDRLHTLLARMDADWRTMAASVAHVARTGEAQQTLLDVLGLHAGSVEYHQRYAESFDQLYNKLVLQFGHFWGGLLAAWLRDRGRQLLTQIGADPEAEPPILEKFFYGESPLLDGPVVDDAPLSETTPIQASTPDGRNYVEWLATSSLETIRLQDFGGNPAPRALLFLLLRHARLLGHWDAGTRFLENRALGDPAILRREPSFVHVQSEDETELRGQSKFQHLYAPLPEVTGDETTTLGEYVQLPSVLAGAPETVDLRELVAALEVLQGAPTARLERAFAEHMDCVGYRLDAWKTGLALTRLEELRSRTDDRGTDGIYLGAFGWLEHVRPKPEALTPVQLDPELSAVFERPADAPLRHDPANAGHLHAPSLNQAAAAAILKNAHRVHATEANPEVMAIDLSSSRVRRALGLLEGIRAGQTLEALLGYRFERSLHDEHGLAEVDKFIYPLRQAFPLVANRLKSTVPEEETDITLLEARNVLDGLKLVMRIRSPGTGSYPFGLPVGTAPGQVPPATAEEQAAIDLAADALSSLYDALADLVLAESVYQVVLGNFDRAAANTTAFGKGAHPPETHVVDTPRAGLALTHRVALHLDPSVDPNNSPSSVPMTPRARAEAPLNAWLAERLPDPEDVVVRVTYDTPALAAPKTVTLSQEQLRLQPIDLLFIADLDLEQAMTELDDRIVQAIRYGPDAHPDVAVTIVYTQPVAGKVTFFELAALLRSLRTVLLQSRPLGPTDMAMPLEAKQDETVWDDAELTVRVNAALATLEARKTALSGLVTDTSDLDAYARKVSDAFLRTALSGVPHTGTGEIHDGIRSIYDAISESIEAFVTRWKAKEATYLALLARWPSLTTDEERFALLREAEGQIAATTTAQPPSDPDVYKLQVEATKTQFDGRLTQLENLLRFSTNKLVDFAAAAAALAPLLADHDATPLELADQQAAMAALRDTLVARVEGAAAAVTERIDAAEAELTAAAASTSSPARVELLLAAARHALGEEIVLVPRFELPPARGLEFEHCWNGSAALLADLHAAGRRFPVDDWMYGVARVRDTVNAWENAAVLSEAFGAPRADLTPVQLPFQASDRWTALEFDASAVTANRLLYTAHFATPFSRAADQCGLLLDEWPELVPATDVVSGVAFHFDRPSSHPPQALLLAVPPVLTGQVELGRPDRDAARDARRRQGPRRRAGPRRRVQLRPVPAGDADGSDAVPDHDRDQPRTEHRHLRASSRADAMDPRYLVLDLKAALVEQLFPTVTVWNRLEGRPRRADFDRALKAEVRDALWMLTKQWQIGEFEADDAGSPVFAKVRMRTSPVTRYQAAGGSSEPLPSTVPLEPKVEQRRVRWERDGQNLHLDLRAQLGRQWARLLQDAGLLATYRSQYRTLYQFELPAQDEATDYVYAHRGAWQQYAALAGRAIDGGELHLHLSADQSHRASDGITLAQASHGETLDALGDELERWFGAQYLEPEHDDAWKPSYLEYQFGCSAPDGGVERVFAADEYAQGRLDWYSFDRAAGDLGGAGDPGEQSEVSSFLPSPVTFEGMPDTRWWALEDRKTDFGSVKPSTTDLAQLLLMEFALVYADDWFLVPFRVPASTLARIDGMAVTNTFGERFWIIPAGAGGSQERQRWSMFELSSVEADGQAADGLLIPPVVDAGSGGAPFEDVELARDEVANMVWAVERTVPSITGLGRPGKDEARETRQYHERLVADIAVTPDYRADVAYRAMSDVPEHFIPFVPVHVEGSVREIQLQRSRLLRIIEGDPLPPEKVPPRTSLMREGLDKLEKELYFVHEEEVPRAGARVALSFRRARWTGGEAYVWLGATKQAGRGERSSGLTFDALVDARSRPNE